VYRDAVETAIHLLKFEGKRVMAQPLSELLIGYAPLAEFSDAEMVIPMPLSKKRLAERSFNQAEPLAKAVAERLEIEYRDDILVKRRDTPPQSLFPEREKRESNVRGAFQVRDRSPISGLNLLLVDDVLTTGATASEAAGVLLEAGAKSVYVLTLARAGV
jgi:ComF family protein